MGVIDPLPPLANGRNLVGQQYLEIASSMALRSSADFVPFSAWPVRAGG